MDRLAGLQLFVRIVETGSFSRAAREFNVTQPTATKHLAALEQRFQVRLLNRNSRAVSLTEAGALYYDKCKAVLREFDEVEAFRGPQQNDVHGSLRIGTSLTFGRQIVSPLLIEFMRLHPSLRVDVSHDDRYVDLIAQGIDVAIRLGNLADSTLGGRYLGVNPWVLVASPAYLARRGVPTRAQRPAQPRLPDLHQRAGRRPLADAHAAGRTRVGAAERPAAFEQPGHAVDAARAHMGVTCLPYYVATASIASGELRELMADHALPDQEIHAVYASPKLVPSKVEALIAFLKGCFQPNWWLTQDWAKAPPLSQ